MSRLSTRSGFKRLNLIALLLLLPACSVSSEVDHELQGTQWRLISITDPELQIPAGQEYSLLFDTYGLLGARVDCNSAGGTYQVSGGGRIELDLEIMTFVGCGPESLDNTFFALTGSVTRYEVKSDRLILRTTGAEHKTLIFVADSNQ